MFIYAVRVWIQSQIKPETTDQCVHICLVRVLAATCPGCHAATLRNSLQLLLQSLRNTNRVHGKPRLSATRRVRSCMARHAMPCINDAATQDHPSICNPVGPLQGLTTSWHHLVTEQDQSNTTQ